MSRKSIFALLGVVLVFLKAQFGLALDVTAFVGIIVYLLFEAKLDLKRIGSQLSRFKDPKFYLALVTTLLPVINSEFGLNLPTEAIVGVLSVILALLFGKEYRKA